MLDDLAKSVFIGGPDDSAAVVDIYSTTDSKVKTSLLTRSKEVAGSIMQALTSDPELLFTAASSLMNKGDGLAFNKEDLFSALTSSSLGDSAGGMVSNLSSGLKDNIGKALTSISGNNQLSMGLMSTVGSVTENLSISDLQDSRSMTSFLSTLTENADISKVINLDSEYAVLGTFVNEAIRQGSVGAFDTMLDSYEGKPEYNYVVRRVLSKSISSAVYSGRLEFIKKTITKLGRVAVLAELPNVIEMILMFYRKPKHLKSRQYRGELTKLLEVLVMIDPDWSTYNRDGEEITRIDIFTYAGDDAKMLLALDDDNKVPLMIAEKYPVINCLAKIQSMFPFLVFD